MGLGNRTWARKIKIGTKVDKEGKELGDLKKSTRHMQLMIVQAEDLMKYI